MPRLILSAFSIVLILFAAPISSSASDAQAFRFAEGVGTKALKILNTSESAEQMKHSLSDLFVSTVDTNWVGRFVLGRYWKEMNDAQKQKYLASYRSFLVQTYTSNFQAYSNNTNIEVKQAKPLKRKGQYLVGMNVERPNQIIHVDFRLRKKNAAFKIIDVVVEGVSLLATQRSEFASVVQRNGIDYLITQLHQKTQ